MRRAVLLLLALLTPVAGCAAPASRVAFRPGTRPATISQGTDASYSLFRTDGPGGHVATVPVPRWERVGFRVESDDSVVGVAGDQVIPLAVGEYVWVRDGTTPESERRERRLRRIRNAALVSAGVVLVGIVGLGVAIVVVLDGSNFGP